MPNVEVCRDREKSKGLVMMAQLTAAVAMLGPRMGKRLSADWKRKPRAHTRFVCKALMAPQTELLTPVEYYFHTS